MAGTGIRKIRNDHVLGISSPLPNITSNLRVVYGVLLHGESWLHWTLLRTGPGDAILCIYIYIYVQLQVRCTKKKEHRQDKTCYARTKD